MTRKSLVPIVLPLDPVAAMEAATKQYVDTKQPLPHSHDRVVLDYTSGATTSIPTGTTPTTVGSWATTSGLNTPYWSSVTAGVFTLASGQAGLYLFNASLTWAANTAAMRRSILLAKNGSEVRRSDQVSTQTGGITLFVQHIMPMAVGDTFAVQAVHTAAAATALGSNPGHFYQVWKVSDATAFG